MVLLFIVTSLLFALVMGMTGTAKASNTNTSHRMERHRMERHRMERSPQTVFMDRSTLGEQAIASQYRYVYERERFFDKLKFTGVIIAMIAFYFLFLLPVGEKAPKHNSPVIKEWIIPLSKVPQKTTFKEVNRGDIKTSNDEKSYDQSEINTEYQEDIDEHTLQDYIDAGVF